jgi:hypothetical protein
MPTWVWMALKGARKVPWTKVMAAVMYLNVEGRKYWNRLTPDERKEVLELLVKSRGKRSNLTGADQGRLLDLFGKIRRGDEGNGKKEE